MSIIAQINQTQLSPTAFLQTVLVQFGFSPFNMKKPEVLATLNQFLMEQHGSGRKVVLIVDEAQNLSNRVLEEVRMLSGVETTKEKVLRIILAGQPELNDKAQLAGTAAADAARAPAISSCRADARPRRRPTSIIVWRWPDRKAGEYSPKTPTPPSINIPAACRD